MNSTLQLAAAGVVAVLFVGVEILQRLDAPAIDGISARAGTEAECRAEVVAFPCVRWERHVDEEVSLTTQTILWANGRGNGQPICAGPGGPFLFMLDEPTVQWFALQDFVGDQECLLGSGKYAGHQTLYLGSEPETSHAFVLEIP